MGKLPAMHHPTAERIYALYESSEKQTKRRGYLGGSAVGRACDRELWLGFRWVTRPSFGGRMLRLFNRGHREEPVIVSELRRLGCTVYPLDDNGPQIVAVNELGGHFRGHADGVLEGHPDYGDAPMLLEFKTYNVKSFKTLQAKGVEAAKPEHYAQMQVYMRGLELERALYIAIAKNSDTIYEELVEYDEKAANVLLERAKAIVEGVEPPPRISDDPTGFRCGFCDFNAYCHGDPTEDRDFGMVADVKCRTCVYATPVTEGEGNAVWRCERKDKELSHREQEQACREHVYIPALVPHSTPVDSGDGYVLYQLRKKGGGRWANAGETAFVGEDVPQLTSEMVQRIERPERLLDQPGPRVPEMDGEQGKLDV